MLRLVDYKTDVDVSKYLSDFIFFTKNLTFLRKAFTKGQLLVISQHCVEFKQI